MRLGSGGLGGLLGALDGGDVLEHVSSETSGRNCGFYVASRGIAARHAAQCFKSYLYKA